MYRALPLLIPLLLAAPSWAAKSPHPVATSLATAIDSPAEAQDLRLVYDTVHALYGGDRYELSEGLLVHTHFPRRGQPPVATQSKLTPQQLRSLARLLEGERIWEQRVAERTPLPDESKAMLTLAMSPGDSTTWEWFNDLETNQRLIKIQQLLESWAPAGAP